MMENDGETTDDQNSGWFEVKKKHKTSPKLLVQRSAVRSFNKDKAFSPCYQASTNSEIGNANYREIFTSTKVELSNASSAKIDVTSAGSVPVKTNDEQGVEPQISKPADPNAEAKVIEEVARWDSIPKIKWGNLDDSVFMWNGHSQTPLCFSKTENPGCGVASSDNFEEHGNADNLPVSLSQPNNQDLDERVLVTLESVKEFPGTALSSDMHVESVDMHCEEVKELSSEDVKALSTNGTVDYGNLKANNNGCAISEVGGLQRCDNSDGENWPTPMSPVLGIVQKKVVIDFHPEENGIISSSNLSVNDTDTKTFDLGEDTIHQTVYAGPETSARMPVIVAMESQKFPQDVPTVGTDLGDNEQRESKERFRQRLWCFLFESLNRAVDELYLLCELECDVEQMDEATLVLEEAISDFKDLKCRVGHFENTKRSPCQIREGMPISVKSDHRRPHALSWEVRRMTTSTQRAEILSSSLEAFKKIQMERAGKDMTKYDRKMGVTSSNLQASGGSSETNEVPSNSTKRQASISGNSIMVKQSTAVPRSGRSYLVQGCTPSQNLPSSAAGKCKREPLGPICETHKQMIRKDKESSENKIERIEKKSKSIDPDKKQNSYIEKNKDKQNMMLWKSMDAWKEKRNWEDILKSPLRSSSRVSYSPGMNRKGIDRARVLHDKLMTPEKKKKNAADLKREAEEKHARAMRIRNQLENERLQRLQRTSEKLNRVSEWQAVRSTKLREIMFARHQRSESLHEAYLAGVVRRAGDESSKVNEVRFITSLNEENKKLMLRQKLHDSEVRRAEKLQVIKIKQKGDIAREEAVLERKKLLEAEKLHRLAETQRKKEEAQVRREEERKASSAAREARAVEQLRRKEIRAKAQQEEAEMLAQRLAERLRESEQRRKYYLEQIREKASMDFRDQSSPLQRRITKEAQIGRSMQVSSSENNTAACNSDSDVKLIDGTNQQSIKRRIKRIRQRLMALKHEFIEPSVIAENSGLGPKSSVGAARVKLGRWIQELQRLRQASRERATSIGLIVGDIIKFLDGKDLELHAARQAGLLDFIASALPASHTTKPEACQVTLYLLRLLRVVLSLPANRSYFLVQNLLPPIIPMLSTSLENYIKVAASSNTGSTNLLSSKTSCENLELAAEVLDGFLWIVSIIIGHVHFDDRQIQMQGDLMELIITYQIIHRLRDLFALYDRPLVEGSPFPSSILSSLTLLSVLTSRSGTISSIDWESCVAKTEMINKVGRPKLYDCQDKEDISLVINHFGDRKATLTSNEFIESHSDESAQPSGKEKLLSYEEPLFDIPEGKGLQVVNVKEISDLSIGSVEIESVTERQVKSSLEEQNDVVEGQAKSVTTQKDEKNSKNVPTERKQHDEHIVYNDNGRRKSGILKQHIVCLVSSISETGLISLLSLLTAVLLQANNKLSSEQASYILPSNFEEVATGVLKVLNNLANLDITILQSMLDRPDLKVEFFHLMSFLLTHCSNKWKTANDQVGLLLLESLLLLGYFALFHPENQAVLRWGKSPTILHKVCDLPFVFFSGPELMPILAGTLVASCYGCELNRAVVQQELSTDMLISLLKSCKQGLPSAHVDLLVPDSLIPSDPSEGSQITKDSKKPHSDMHVRSNRRIARVLVGKSIPFSNVRNKTKIQRDCKETKTCEQWVLRDNLPASEASSTFMLHQRFPRSFLDKAEVFFSAEISSEQV